jgi:uncharacterized membrane protein
MSEGTFPWRTLLFVSAALNLLVIGAVAGAYTAGVRLERVDATSARFPTPHMLMAALPRDTRAKVRAELARTWTQTQPLRQQAAQARRDAFTTAAAEPFDPSRVRAAFAHVRETDDASLAAFHDNVIAALSQMTPVERQRAIAALRNSASLQRQAVGPAIRRDASRGAPQPEQDVMTPRQQFRAEMRERIRERREQRLGLTP